MCRVGFPPVILPDTSHVPQESAIKPACDGWLLAKMPRGKKVAGRLAGLLRTAERTSTAQGPVLRPASKRLRPTGGAGSQGRVKHGRCKAHEPGKSQVSDSERSLRSSVPRASLGRSFTSEAVRAAFGQPDLSALFSNFCFSRLSGLDLPGRRFHYRPYRSVGRSTQPSPRWA